jgi:hypothetical protein
VYLRVNLKLKTQKFVRRPRLRGRVPVSSPCMFSLRFQAVEFQHFVKRGSKTKEAPLNERVKEASA